MAAMRVQNILRAQGRALNLPLGAPCLEISLPGVTSSSCAAPLSWQGGSKRWPPPRHCQALFDSRKRGFYSLPGGQMRQMPASFEQERFWLLAGPF